MWQPTVSSDEYLMHHGILGQKWGVRRYQNEDGTLTNAGKRRYGADTVDSINSAKGIKRRLNDLDQAKAFNKRDIKESIDHSKYYSKKAKKLKAKGGNKDKISELEKKSQNRLDDANVFADNIKRGHEETNKLLAKAKKNGYTVKAIASTRDVTRGKEWIMQVGVNMLASALTGGASYGYYTNYVTSGTHYSVKDKKSK